MKRRWTFVAAVGVSSLLLSGCLFTINQPVVGPDGSLAVFLTAEGEYSLFPEAGVLNYLTDGVWTAIPGATLSGTGGLRDVSPDGSAYLYVDEEPRGLLETPLSRLFRVGASPDAEPVLLLETERSIVDTAWEDQGILILTFGQPESSWLERLDPDTGTRTPLVDNVISFSVSEASGRIILMRAERLDTAVLGRLEWWDPSTGESDALAARFVLGEASSYAYVMEPHNYLWDVSADGRWIALSLYDGTVIDPPSDDDAPAVYLIDSELSDAERIAARGIMPAFSPDGTALAYIASDDGISWHVVLRDLGTEESQMLPGSDGAQAVIWVMPDRLAVTFEGENDRLRLIEFELSTGSSTERIGG